MILVFKNFIVSLHILFMGHNPSRNLGLCYPQHSKTLPKAISLGHLREN